MKKKLILGLVTTVLAFFSIVYMCLPEGGDNIKWMHRIADIVIKYDASQNSLPNSVDEALDALKVTLPHRGDAEGHLLIYKKVSAHAFFLIAGQGDTNNTLNKAPRIALFFIDGQEVPNLLELYKGYVEQK